MAKTELVENIGGDFGVTVIYTLEHQTSVQFFAAEIMGRTHPDNAALYTRKGASSSDDDVSDPRLAERYLEGTVKWDGCSHIYFGEADNEGYLHLCGRENFDKLANAMSAVYERCGELMAERGCHLLEKEFKAGSPA